jgi:hypothetical protein
VTEVIDCEGAPRDLGQDQGRRCRASLLADYRARSLWRRLLFRLRADRATGRRIERDLRRFFPAQAEALEAIARAARVSSAWLLEKLAVDAVVGPAMHPVALAAGAALTAGGGLLARTPPDDAIVRRNRPDGGFRSIDLTQPWRTAPLAGVNEAGLAVVCVSEASDFDEIGCTAPAVLLAQDCLARFDRIDGAVDWLLARPGAGRSSILLAHADGEVAAVRVRGSSREVFRPADGLFLDAGERDRQPEIEKRLRLTSSLTGSDLVRALETPIVVVEPDQRRIGLLHAPVVGDGGQWFGV